MKTLFRTSKHKRMNDMKSLTREEFYKALNFLLLHGVINYKEYGEIESKTLPFLKK